MANRIEQTRTYIYEPAATASIADDAVTFAKMQNITASKLIGRGSAAGTGDPQEIALGSNLSMSGTTLNATGGGGGGGYPPQLAYLNW